MSNEIKISVIIPVYNAEKYIVKCLDSVLNQTFRNFELICVDDCSQDKSLGILNEYAEKDSRIKVIALKSNKKQGGARNEALKIAKGKYITFVDSDDYIDSTLLEKMYEVAERNYCDLVVTNVVNTAEYDDETLLQLKYDLDRYYKPLELYNGFHFYDFNNRKLRVGPVAKLYKKSIIDEYKIKFPENLIHEDEAFYWFYMPYTENLYYVNQDLYFRNIHTNSTMYNLKCRHKNELDHLLIIKEIYKYLKKNKLYSLYKERFIEYVSSVINSQPCSNIKKKYFTQIALFMPEILRFPIQEKMLEGIFLKEILFTNKKIIFWGASKFLQNFIEKYNINNKNIIGIIDKNSIRWGEKIGRYEIFSPEKLSTVQNCKVIFSIKNNAHVIYEELKEEFAKNYPNIELSANFFKDEKQIHRLKILHAKKNYTKKKLSHVEFHVVEHCNLSCRGCNHFSPLAEELYSDVVQFEKDISRIAELTNGNIKHFGLLGGEPLLHPDISDFMRIARAKLPQTYITILTNAVKLNSMDDKFWESCKKYNVAINITKYPINLDFDKIEKTAAKFDVSLEYFGSSATQVKTSDTYPLDLSGKQNKVYNFKNCMLANHCIFLRSGKLYTCAIAPNIEHFNKFFKCHIPLSKKDGIDIYQAKSLKQILKFLSKPIPFCKYCNVKGRVVGKNQWGISKKIIEEWT